MVSVSVDLSVQSSDEERRIVEPQAAAAGGAPTHDDAAATIGGVIANALPNLADRGEASSNAAATASPATAVATGDPHALVTTETVQKSRTPAGKETIRSASVVVPRSYFVGIYRRANRKQSQATDPDDALLQPVIDAHLIKIRGLVRNSLGLGNDDDVTVESYDDFATTAAASAPAATGANAPVAASVSAVPTPSAALLKASPQQIALAVLSLATLVLLSLLVRKRTEGSTASAASLMAAVPAAGRGGSAAVLSGTLETPSASLSASHASDDPTAAESHRMFHRVREVVGENPDDAARVLREWIYQGQ